MGVSELITDNRCACIPCVKSLKNKALKTVGSDVINWAIKFDHLMQKWRSGVVPSGRYKVGSDFWPIIGDLTLCTFMYIYHNLICVASWHVRTGTVYTELCPHLYTVNTGEECVYNWSCLYMKLHSAKIHAVLGPSSHWSNVPFGGVLHVKLNVLPYLYPSWQSPFI